MLRQNQLFRSARDRVVPRPAPAASRPTRRCSSGSTASTTTSGSPNENYAREMMELFSLGADRGAYTEDDVREQARALTGWTNSWSRAKGAYNFRFRQGPPRRRRRRRSSASAGASTGSDSVRLCVEPPEASLVLRDEALELLRPDRRSTRARSARWSASTSRPATRSSRSSAAILMHPQLYDGPADGEVADRLHRRPDAPPRTARRHDRATSGSTTSPASASSSRRTSRAGTRAAGSTPRRFRGRWMTASKILAKSAINPDKKHHQKVAPSAQAIVKDALAHWHNPQLGPESMAALHDFAERAMAAADEDWKRVTVSAPRRERGARADRRLAGDAGRVSDPAHCSCTEFSRAHLLRRGVAEAGNGLPAIEPRDAAAGRDGPVPPPLPRRLARARALGLRREPPRPPRLRRGDRGGRGAARERAGSSSRSSSRAAPTRSRCSRR